MKYVLTAAIAAGVSLCVSFGFQTWTTKRVLVERVGLSGTAQGSKYAWPDLTTDETIAIGEAIGSLKDAEVQIICNDAACNDLAHDLDNAMEIAGARSSLDRSPFPLGYGFAVVTGPGDPRGSQLAGAIKIATKGRLAPDVEPKAKPGELFVIIGKRR
jgi:hypothetical protein